MTKEEIENIDKILTSGKKVLGWCCVCGTPIVDGGWILICKVKHDDTYKKGFRVDNLKRHTGCEKE